MNKGLIQPVPNPDDYLKTFFAYKGQRSTDGIVLCRCPIPLGGKCSYHSKIVDLRNRFTTYDLAEKGSKDYSVKTTFRIDKKNIIVEEFSKLTKKQYADIKSLCRKRKFPLSKNYPKYIMISSGK